MIMTEFPEAQSLSRSSPVSITEICESSRAQRVLYAVHLLGFIFCSLGTRNSATDTEICRMPHYTKRRTRKHCTLSEYLNLLYSDTLLLSMFPLKDLVCCDKNRIFFAYLLLSETYHKDKLKFKTLVITVSVSTLYSYLRKHSVICRH